MRLTSTAINSSVASSISGASPPFAAADKASSVIVAAVATVASLDGSAALTVHGGRYAADVNSSVASSGSGVSLLPSNSAVASAF